MESSSLHALVSALMDGEGDAAAWARVEHDPAARAAWLLYHQIGDVLRAPDLQPLPHEHAFVREVSARIEREAPPVRRRSGRWPGALAALAGVAAAVLLTLRLPLQQSGAQLAELDASLQPVTGLMRAGWQASRDGAPQPQLLAEAGAQSDWAPYLLAHEQLAASPLGDPEPAWPDSVHAWR